MIGISSHVWSAKGLKLINLFGVLLSTSFFTAVYSQNNRSVHVLAPKKKGEPNTYRLMIENFPRSAGSVKSIVNQIGNTVGVDNFNIINHPEGKPAEGILKILSGVSAESVLQEVLCALPAQKYRYKKTTFSDCRVFTLNKK
jgi:hypothetical protein